MNNGDFKVKKYFFVLGCLFFALFQREVWANRAFPQNMTIPIKNVDVSYTGRQIQERGNIVSNGFTVINNRAVELDADTEFRYAIDYKHTGVIKKCGTYDDYTLFCFKNYPNVGIVLEGGSDGEYDNKVNENAGNNRFRMYAENYLGGIALYPTHESQAGGAGANQRIYDLGISAKIVLLKELTQDITIPQMFIGTVNVSFCDYSSDPNNSSLCYYNYEYEGTTPVGYVSISGFKLKHIPKTCSITGNKDITVNLKPVFKREFKNNGDEILGGATKIGLKCSNVVEKLYVTFEDANNPNNTTNVLTTKGGAQKVGIVLKRTGPSGKTTVTYGKHPTDLNPRHVKDIKNKLLVAQKQTAPSLNLEAYYKRLGDIKPGNVEARATIKFTYE
ncbi:hypothetical protein B0186_02070 [Canicola haemoglobinophilus]|uniref:Fimbrial adhesin n=1 Tax=Canicola haemoglobinophilus TaxID=733 RepID=A0A1V4B315_9PAST|nr:fimbrial protein [Canicola haemoglobinophilus]OOS01670.1 hypothetical protein B0186_02070 [Canicola haemoglobinophilus]STO59117.1 fimbrial adhesin [Canicola haemoglobinophilus]